LWEKLRSVVCANNLHDLEALKQNICEQFTTFSNVNYKFPEICLREFRHVSKQRADILNIFYDGKYDINYYI
jgi:hypothetical protein